ncbi:DUF4087 domain-containing protein [Paraburkholderia sp. OAS925]|uniref:DUF4087 domain-containing protein n=1 Tax=Paraburkholderia sp. OAS925 TaxID=2663827 RepID=UPI003672A4D4
MTGRTRLSFAAHRHTNAGGPGYGCACIDMDADGATGKVLRLYSAEVLPLERCKTDRSPPPR